MNSSRLFTASRIALIVTAMSFALRGACVGSWVSEFNLTHEEVGWIDGTAFYGFTLAMIFGGPLCDVLGLGRIAAFAFAGHLVGILLTLFAWNFWSLYIGTLIFGIANGSVEAACNPLIATLYPNDKTTKLNKFHVWWPGGIVIGGILAYALSHAGLGWKPQFATMLVPLAAYGFLFLGQEFPRTERVQQGVTTREMFSACLNPWFLLMVVCMLMTASTELGPAQWIPNVLTHAGVPGILVLAWISGLMAIGRNYAGAFVHRLSPLGMLLASAVLSALGLFAMSHAGGGMLFAAATLFAVGVCFFWPTMLGYVSETFSKTGALGLAIMGGVGTLSVSFVLPLIGRFYDRAIIARMPAGHTAAELAAAPAGQRLGGGLVGGASFGRPASPRPGGGPAGGALLCLSRAISQSALERKPPCRRTKVGRASVLAYSFQLCDTLQNYPTLHSPMSTDPTDLPIHRLVPAMAARRWSPVDLVEGYLERVRRLDPKLHAYIALYSEDARLAAQAAEMAIRSGHRVGTFHGIPIAIKDVIEIEGRITTAGAKLWRERVSPTTATVVRKLLGAGMIILGKTHTVEFALGGWGTNQHMGTPWNPWDANVARCPGGSSSGSGVAVAGRLAPCAIGTDTGGSIRLPSSFCGIVGLKTTVGRISTHGILPLAPTLDTPGPMVRSVEDAALLLTLLQGGDPLDPKNAGPDSGRSSSEFAPRSGGADPRRSSQKRARGDRPGSPGRL